MANASFQRGLILHHQGRYADAVGQFRQALAMEPGNAQAHAMLGLCLIEQDELSGATAEAQEAIGLDPELPLGHAALATAMSRRNRLDEALAAAAEAIRLDPYDPYHFALYGSIRFDRRDWPAALEAAEKGLAIDPDHDWCLNLRAMSLVQLGRRDEAAQTIHGALEKDPQNAITHANQGWALLHRGQHKKAMEHFREALRLDPQMDWAKAGIVEALKSSFFLYRWLLMFALWMSRLSQRAQWGIIIGGWFGYQLVRGVARTNPNLKPILTPIIVAYAVFAISTWLASPLLNLLLRLHRFGRYALSRDQIMASNLLGVMLVLTIGGLVAWLGYEYQPGQEIAIVCALLMLPMSGIFFCEPGWPRWMMISICAALAFIGGIVIATAVVMPAPVKGHPLVAIANTLLGLFILGSIASQFAANYLRTVRVRS